MSKFTPGPWKIIPGLCKTKVYAGDKYQGHFCIADCHQFDIANDSEAATTEKEANAALIAAAPAMYEALFASNKQLANARAEIERLQAELKEIANSCAETQLDADWCKACTSRKWCAAGQSLIEAAERASSCET